MKYIPRRKARRQHRNVFGKKQRDWMVHLDALIKHYHLAVKLHYPRGGKEWTKAEDKALLKTIRLWPKTESTTAACRCASKYLGRTANACATRLATLRFAEKRVEEDRRRRR